MAGCGANSGEDIVYLHVIHGYAGGGAVTIFGPSGKLATNLKFGEAAGPVAFDRSTYQNVMTVQLEGVPGAVDKNFDLFSLYPGEHATLFLQRRSGYREIELTMLRHHQLTIQATAEPLFTCAFELTNALSLTNDLSIAPMFEFMTEWRFSQTQYLNYYDPSRESRVETECGPVEVNELPGGAAILQQRREVHDRIMNQPWFFPVNAEDSSGAGGAALTFVKGFAADSGSVVAWRPTFEYRDCLAQAVQIEQPEPDPNNPMMMQSNCETGPDGQQRVPRDPTGRPLVTVDRLAVEQCLLPKGYTGPSHPPTTQTTYAFYYNPDVAAGGRCNQVFRLRTPNVDAIFDPAVTSGGQLVQVNMGMPKGTWQHVVVYGRPVAPMVYQFTSDDVGNQLAQDWSAPEYPNQVIPPDPGTARGQTVVRDQP